MNSAASAETIMPPSVVSAPDDSGATSIPDFMKIVVVNEGSPATKDQIAFDNIYALDDAMFRIYDKSLEIYKQHFRERQNLIRTGISSQRAGFFRLNP